MSKKIFDFLRDLRVFRRKNCSAAREGAGTGGHGSPVPADTSRPRRPRRFLRAPRRRKVEETKLLRFLGLFYTKICVDGLTRILASFELFCPKLSFYQTLTRLRMIKLFVFIISLKIKTKIIYGNAHTRRIK